MVLVVVGGTGRHVRALPLGGTSVRFLKTASASGGLHLNPFFEDRVPAIQEWVNNVEHRAVPRAVGARNRPESGPTPPPSPPRARPASGGALSDGRRGLVRATLEAEQAAQAERVHFNLTLGRTASDVAYSESERSTPPLRPQGLEDPLLPAALRPRSAVALVAPVSRPASRPGPDGFLPSAPPRWQRRVSAPPPAASWPGPLSLVPEAAPVAAASRPLSVAAPMTPAPVAAASRPRPVASPPTPAPVEAALPPRPMAAPPTPQPVAAASRPRPVAAPPAHAPVTATFLPRPVAPAPGAAPVAAAFRPLHPAVRVNRDCKIGRVVAPRMRGPRQGH